MYRALSVLASLPNVINKSSSFNGTSLVADLPRLLSMAFLFDVDFYACVFVGLVLMLIFAVFGRFVSSFTKRPIHVIWDGLLGI